MAHGAQNVIFYDSVLHLVTMPILAIFLAVQIVAIGVATMIARLGLG